MLVEPTAELLGLELRSRQGHLLQVIDGVEVDSSSNELTGVLRGVVPGNGNSVAPSETSLRVTSDSFRSLPDTWYPRRPSPPISAVGRR